LPDRRPALSLRGLQRTCLGINPAEPTARRQRPAAGGPDVLFLHHPLDVMPRPRARARAIAQFDIKLCDPLEALAVDSAVLSGLVLQDGRDTAVEVALQQELTLIHHR